MALQNVEIAGKFSRIADLLEIKGDNNFRIQSYRNVARLLENLPQSISELVDQEFDFTTIKGIGKELDKKIKDLVRTGRIPLLSSLEKELPSGLLELIELPGLGGKRVHLLYQQLGIKNLNDLLAAAQKGLISQLSGFGPKLEKNILEEIKQKLAQGPKRLRLDMADATAQRVLDYLRTFGPIPSLEVAGSFRRQCETIGDLDILAAGQRLQGLTAHFERYDQVTRVLAKGPTKTSVMLQSGVQVDLRVVASESFGAAMVYFTGSKAHNIHLRKMAQEQKLKINEYGVFRGDETIAGKTEKDVYRAVGLDYIPPELREDQGELEAVTRKRLPRLVSLKDIRGDLHMHTRATDGQSSLGDMVDAARKLGYRYVGNTEHSQRLAVAHGLNPKTLSKHLQVIDHLNAKLTDLVVLKGIEVDILEDGSLDLPDASLRDLDFVIASVHYKFNLKADQQTERLIRAMDNPYVTIIGHPTGRLINERRPYEIHMERFIQAAAERGCWLELDAHPERLDLNDQHCRMAKDKGVKIAISTDAHSPAGYGHMRFGIGQARRGWLEKGDIVNTRSLEDLHALLRKP